MKRLATVCLLMIGALTASLSFADVPPAFAGFAASHEVVQPAVLVDMAPMGFEIAKLDLLPVTLTDAVVTRPRLVLFTERVAKGNTLAANPYVCPSLGSPWRPLRTSA